MAFKKFELNKLVRDNIPSILRDKDIQVTSTTIIESEFVLKLKDKLVEEANEVRSSETRKELVEELADVLEVLMSLINASELSMEQIEEKRLLKRELKGSFEGKTYVEFIELEESNSEINYFKNGSGLCNSL